MKSVQVDKKIRKHFRNTNILLFYYYCLIFNLIVVQGKYCRTGSAFRFLKAAMEPIEKIGPYFVAHKKIKLPCFGIALYLNYSFNICYIETVILQ